MKLTHSNQAGLPLNNPTLSGSPLNTPHIKSSAIYRVYLVREAVFAGERVKVIGEVIGDYNSRGKADAAASATYECAVVFVGGRKGL